KGAVSSSFAKTVFILCATWNFGSGEAGKNRDRGIPREYGREGWHKNKSLYADRWERKKIPVFACGEDKLGCKCMVFSAFFFQKWPDKSSKFARILPFL